MKKQKNCNFCGETLPYPTKFCFSRKCSKCSMKNSTLLLPARFLCNMCIDNSENDLFTCHNDQIPLEGIKNAKSFQSIAQIHSILEVIAEVLTLFLEDMKDNQSFYFDEKVACIEKASNPQHLYSNLLVVLTNRILKLLLQVYRHNISVKKNIEDVFEQVAS